MCLICFCPPSQNEIESDLTRYGCLTENVKRQIGRYFVDGMRIRSGVHYKDAKRVEAALFRSIELHLRYRPPTSDLTAVDKLRTYVCTGCNTEFKEASVWNICFPIFDSVCLLVIYDYKLGSKFHTISQLYKLLSCKNNKVHRMT